MATSTSMKKFYTALVGTVSLAIGGVITLPEQARAASFNYTNFSSTNEFTLNGNAAQFGDRLRLTPSADYQAGAAWYNTKQLVQEGFESTFQFQITELVDGGADGLAFVIQNSSLSALGSTGGNIGYSNISNSLAIEFDTWQNAQIGNGDPNNNHISVQTRGTLANSSDHIYSLGFTTIPSLSNQQIHTAKIAYTPGSLSIFLDDLLNPALTVSVDLANTLNLDNGKAWLGFTAATGASWENHDIISWSHTDEVTSVPEPSFALGLLIVSAFSFSSLLKHKYQQKADDFNLK